jgi:hypothetical protein
MGKNLFLLHPQSLRSTAVAAVRSAKAYKYAYEAQDAAQEWADFFLGGFYFTEQAGCDPLIPSKTDLINKAFGPLVDSSDGLVPGGMNYDDLPCPAKQRMQRPKLQK